jgi:hypothetical protein
LYDGRKEGVVFMEWLQYLLLLLCPLMMIFCMRGHGGGHNHQHGQHISPSTDLKLKLLEEENNKLKNEMEELAKVIKKGS